MKKLLRAIKALGLITVVLAFAGCDMLTEEELLATVGKKVDGGSVLWSSFEGAAMQVWLGETSKKETAELHETADGLTIKIKDEGWWGMCFCNDAGVGADQNPVTFDMSGIAKITFEAKASEKASMWISQSPKDSKPVNQKAVSLGTSFEPKEYSLTNPGKDCYGVFDLGGGDKDTTTKSGVVITIKNIKFLDKDGKEIAPSRNE